MKTLSRAQAALAARLYALSIVAALDEGGAVDDETGSIRRHAANRAIKQLERLNVDASLLTTDRQCIDMARSLKS